MPRKLILEGQPISTQHIYANNGRGGRFMSPEAKALKDGYGWQAKSQWKGKPVATRCAVRVDFYFADNRKRDLDNHNKIVLDSLNGIVYDDDKLIDDLHLVRRFDPKKPRVEVTVTQL